MPLAAGLDRLQFGVPAFMGQIHSVRNGGHGLEANVILAGRRVDDTDCVARAERDLDTLALAFDREYRAPRGVSHQIGEPVIELMLPQ